MRVPVRHALSIYVGNLNIHFKREDQIVRLLVRVSETVYGNHAVCVPNFTNAFKAYAIVRIVYQTESGHARRFGGLWPTNGIN